MEYRFNQIRDLSGSLIAVDGSGTLDDVYIELDSTSAIKLANVLAKHRVERENQDLTINSISINVADMSTFTKGQSNIVQRGNTYVVLSEPSHPVRFIGKFQALIPGSDGKDYACSIEIGNIAFIVDDNPTIVDDVAVYRNAKATLYPDSRYKATVLGE